MPSPPAPRPPASLLERLPAAAMLAGAALLYLPAGLSRGHTLLGLDYGQLHQSRLEYALEALAAGSLPAWFTRELLGTPFLANATNFPWIPTHLALLLAPPSHAYGLGVVLAALLAAGFSYLFLRRLGLGPVGSALGGFSFAASGFLASRVLAGQLTLIEGYPALPLLLWLVERARREGKPDEAPATLDLLALAGAAGLTCLAGHPQLPAYALAAAGFYALGRGGGVRSVLALGLGAGLALFAWAPVLVFAADSTRALGLPHDPALDNDVWFPAWRLKAFVAPWADGWPPPLAGRDHPFAGANVATFWDTVCYVGLAPLAAAGWLGAAAARRRRLPPRPALLLAILGAVALLFALSWARELASAGGLMLLRSPSRQVYVTTFALCAALAAGVDRLLAGRGRGAVAAAALVCLVQVVDVGRHARAYVLAEPTGQSLPAGLQRVLEAELGDRRVAVEFALYQAMLRDRDRVGFYDAMPLARTFLAIHALERGVAVEREHLDGSFLSAGTLARLGVGYVVTRARRRDLELRAAASGVGLYRIERPEPRVAFFPEQRVEYLPEPDLIDALRREESPRLWLPSRARRKDPDADPGTPAVGTTPDYARPTPDRIVVELSTASRGWVRVLESWHRGWSARVDGRAVEVLPADGFALAVPVEAGAQRVELEFRTPGRRLGWLGTGASALALGIWLGIDRRRRRVG